MASDVMKLAVLIDGDNVSPDLIEGVFARVATLGRPVLRAVYGSQGDKAKWLKAASRFALSQGRRHLYATGHNATDIEMVIGAMDIMVRSDIDGLCLVSADSDFTSLAIRIREGGKLAYGFGDKKAAEGLRNAYDAFYEIDLKQEETSPAAPKPVSKSAKKKKLPPERAIPLLREAFEACASNGWAAVSKAATHLASTHPNFSAKSYGSGGIKKLIKACGGFELDRISDLDVYRPLKAENSLKLVKA